jgi:hypothetical protein
MTFPGVVRETSSGREMVEAPRVIHMEGTWGATVQAERHAVSDMPIGDAVELLERTLADRVALRVAAWKQLVKKRTVSSIGTLPFTKRERRIMAILGLSLHDFVTPMTAPPAACESCGERLGWRKRSDARTCSSRCRQASYRQRAAA